ncbi:hypothetical protein L7F22_003902 [Adiantum nelumboides]|nr:hypothetical protein [Adiantum nelumboides]
MPLLQMTAAVGMAGFRSAAVNSVWDLAPSGLRAAVERVRTHVEDLAMSITAKAATEAVAKALGMSDFYAGRASAEDCANVFVCGLTSEGKSFCFIRASAEAYDAAHNSPDALIDADSAEDQLVDVATEHLGTDHAEKKGERPEDVKRDSAEDHDAAAADGDSAEDQGPAPAGGAADKDSLVEDAAEQTSTSAEKEGVSKGPMSGKGVAMAAAAAAIGVAASPLWVPAVVGMAGFGASGVVASSWGAALMSTYGGLVPAGSVCAMLQSVGTAGLATSTIFATEGVAASLAGVSGYLFNHASTKIDHHAGPAAEDAPGSRAEEQGKETAPVSTEKGCSCSHA